MKKLNQELYDQLFGAIVYIIEYSKKYNISIPNGEALKRMTDKIHSLMDVIEPSSDESLQSERKDKTDGDLTEPYNCIEAVVNELQFQ
jgi:hypothetical protein